MTKVGVAFIISGLFIYFLASQTQVGWVYLFDAIIWSLLVVAAVVPRVGLMSLKVERQVLLSRVTQAGLSGPLEDEEVEFKITVTNSGRFARHFIQVLENCPFAPPEKQQRRFFIPRLEPKSSISFYYNTLCYARGYYTSTTITLQSSDPIGLMVKRKSCSLPLDLTVYPAYYPMEAVPVAEAAWAEWGKTARASAAEELYGSREYRYGDPLKHIHWRNTARLGQFMLKEFEQPLHGSITVLIDTRHDNGGGRETTLEYSIKIAASLSRLCTDLGQSLNITAGAETRYHLGWREAMDFLARMEAGGSAVPESAVLPEPGQVIVAIVPAREVDLIPTLARLAGGSKEVIVLLERFALGESPEAFFSGLRSANIDIVRCTAGNLEAGIKQIAGSTFFSGKPAGV